MSINAKIFKNYDVRGIFPRELDAKAAYQIGRAFADLLNTKEIAVGRDMRTSGEHLFQNLQKGIREGGTNVIDLGLVSTDMVYFAVGKYNYGGGVMITASHNPAEYNGFKFCREKALPISGETGLFAMRDEILAGKYKKETADPLMQGKISKKDVMDNWLKHALGFINEAKLKPLRVVVDAGNGMAGKIIPELARRVPLKVFPLYFELDGHFLNHAPNPLLPEALKDLRQEVLDKKADLGMIFDGDADRVFFLDETGTLLSGTVMTALIADNLLKKTPGSVVLYNAICGWIVPEIVEKNRGTAIRTRVGHSLIKADMQKTNAIFAGEHSGHYYFRDNFGADSALIAALILLEMLCQDGRKLSEIRAQYDRFPESGEINRKVSDVTSIITLIEKHYHDAETIDHLDGLTIRYKDFWFNLRPSNTEPLLRLNLEARGPELMALKRDEVLRLIDDEVNKQKEAQRKKGPPRLFEV